MSREECGGERGEGRGERGEGRGERGEGKGGQCTLKKKYPKKKSIGEGKRHM